MEDEVLERITNDIISKIGEENSALIADNILELKSANKIVNEEIEKKEKEIENLKTSNEKILETNGKLFQQVAQGLDTKKIKNEQIEDKKISLKDCFDNMGNFK